MTILPHPNIIQKLRELLINSLCTPEKWSKHLCGCPWVCVESLKRHCNMHTHFIFCTSARLFVSCHFKLKHMTAIIFILMSSLLNLSHQLVFNRRNLTARFFHAPTVQKSQLFQKVNAATARLDHRLSQKIITVHGRHLAQKCWSLCQHFFFFPSVWSCTSCHWQSLCLHIISFQNASDDFSSFFFFIPSRTRRLSLQVYKTNTWQMKRRHGS